MDVTDIDGGVRVLAFDRPDKLNALDAALTRRAADAFAAAGADDAVRVVVLTGSGPAFCAGADRADLEAIARGELSTDDHVAFRDELQRFAKPLFVAVNGVAVGMGTTLCLHADVVVAARSARFRTPFTALGVAPEIGSSWLLPHQVGHQMAAWMLLSSAWVEAEEARAHGLVLRVVDDAEVLDATVDMALAVAAHDPAAVAAVKRTMRDHRDGPIERASAVENDEFRALSRRRFA